MSDYYISIDSDGKVICHHGIKGQKWGVRRFQNRDGSLTALGRARSGTRNDTSSEVSNEEKRSSFDKEKAKKIAKTA